MYSKRCMRRSKKLGEGVLRQNRIIRYDNVLKEEGAYSDFSHFHNSLDIAVMSAILDICISTLFASLCKSK